MNNYYQRSGCNCHMQNDNNNRDHERIFYSDSIPLGIGYVPWQGCPDRMEESVYDLNAGFDAGTIFPCLNKPFLGRRICS